MKFAMITADPTHGQSFRINPETSDATSFMCWIDIWKGVHFNFQRILEQLDILRSFDVVMMSGHPSHIVDITKIAEYLKSTEAISIFYPEGSAQLYDNSIRGFHPEVYEAWRACDVFSAAEEDKIAYYESFVGSNTIVRFIHVPMTEAMSRGDFLTPRQSKDMDSIAIYCDNNPNHPLIAAACARKLGKRVVFVEGAGNGVFRALPGLRAVFSEKMGQNPYLRLLGRTGLHFYPTEWIGTSREAIACAAAGTPCIGSNLSHTQVRLFPDLSFGHYEIDKMCAKAEQLLVDEAYYLAVAARAFGEAQRYGMEATKARFLKAIQDAREMKMKTRLPIPAEIRA